MPNHVRNIIKMEGIEKLSLIKVNDEGEKVFDFNALIPMPESLNMESGTIEEIAIEAAIRKLAKRRYDFQRPYATPAMTDKKYWERVSNCRESQDELIELGLQYITNKIKYGATTWYDWNVENWGTKWNSYDNEIEKNCVKFSTAWSDPTPIIRKLSEKYPDVKVEHWWADEDMGNNTGHRILIAGKEIQNVSAEYANESQDAYECYVFCWGESKCLHKDESGNWVRNECEECDGCD